MLKNARNHSTCVCDNRFDDIIKHSVIPLPAQNNKHTT